MVGTTVTKAFDTGLDRAETESFMGMRLKSVVNNMRAIKLYTRAMHRAAKLGRILRMIEMYGDALHTGIMARPAGTRGWKPGGEAE
jgi:hypothetical protein